MIKKRDYTKIGFQELRYLVAWLRRQGLRKVWKFKHSPEILLNEYLAFAKEDNCPYLPDNDESQRLAVILDYIDYIVNTYPRFRRFLKFNNLKGYEVGLMLGFKNPASWNNSIKRFTYVRFLMKMIDINEASKQAYK